MLEYLNEGDAGCRFVVKSAQGHPLLESVAFPSREDAREEVRRLQPKLRDPAIFERRTDHRGRFQFTLRSPGGKVLGHSQFYRSEAGMENGIANIRNQMGSQEP